MTEDMRKVMRELVKDYGVSVAAVVTPTYDDPLKLGNSNDDLNHARTLGTPEDPLPDPFADWKPVPDPFADWTPTPNPFADWTPTPDPFADWRRPGSLRGAGRRILRPQRRRRAVPGRPGHWY